MSDELSDEYYSEDDIVHLHELDLAYREGRKSRNAEIELLKAENAALRAWIEEARDTVLYPVAHEDTSVGKLAECLGASTVELLKPNENCNAR